jgi:hypothetical protein
MDNRSLVRLFAKPLLVVGPILIEFVIVIIAQRPECTLLYGQY